ncbi:hypothetical protein E2542_SST25417 [Spatholobus suberectus]|nr:hypothetical protein E2542_SST25417 [Spatholobus suberectus]
MGIRFLTWFLFVSCIQAISSSDFHRNFSSEQTVGNPSKSNIVQTRESLEKYGIIKEALRLDTKVEDKYDLSHGSKTQRGRGAYGGADVNHHPGHNSAASLLPCISTLSVGLTLILLFSFYLR